MSKSPKRKVSLKNRCKIGNSTLDFTVREWIRYSDKQGPVKAFAPWPRKRQQTTEKGSTKIGHCWMYVFTLEKWGSLLQVEARVEEGKDSYKNVLWRRRRPQKDWQGVDRRKPTSKIVDRLSVRGGSFCDDEGGVWIMLSRIQLPRKRLDEYMGSVKDRPDVKNNVRARCTRLFFEEGLNVDEPRKAKEKGEKSRPYTFYLDEPITAADTAQKRFLDSYRRKKMYMEKTAVQHTIASAALSLVKPIKKKNSQFVYGDPPDFRESGADELKQLIESKVARHDRVLERNGRRFVQATDSEAYDFAMKDHIAGRDFIDEYGRIEARHASGKSLSKATRKQLMTHLKDSGHRVHSIFNAERAFQTLRKAALWQQTAASITLDYSLVSVTEFMGEGPLYDHKGRRTGKGYTFAWNTIEKSVLNWTGLELDQYIQAWEMQNPVDEGRWLTESEKNRRHTIGAEKMSRLPRVVIAIDEVELAPQIKKLPDATRRTWMVMFEGVNLLWGWVSFFSNKDKKFVDYAGFLGDLMDLSEALADDVKLLLKAKDWKLTKGTFRWTRANDIPNMDDMFANSAKLSRWGFAISTISLVGTIADMVESASGAQKVAGKGGQIGVFYSYMTMFVGQTIALTSLVFLPGLAIVPIIGIILVIVGIIALWMSTDSPIESWLKKSWWGIDFDGNGLQEEAQLKSLLKLLTMFQIDVSISGKNLQFTITPGIVTPRSNFNLQIYNGRHGKPKVLTLGSNQAVIKNIPAKMNKDGSGKPLTFTMPIIYTRRQDVAVEGRPVWKEIPLNVYIVGKFDLYGDHKFTTPQGTKSANWSFEWRDDNDQGHSSRVLDRDVDFP